MARPTNITHCSFCGRPSTDVKKMIAGQDACICDTCIRLCNSALDKELDGEYRQSRELALSENAS